MSCERRNLARQFCGFEAVLKAKVLTFGSLVKSFLLLLGQKMFFQLKVLASAAAHAQREWKMQVGNFLEKF